MNLKDYIFYRVYVSYKRANEPARFSTIIYFLMIEFGLGIPFVTFIMNLFTLDGNIRDIIGAIYLILLFILNNKRYNKKKVNELTKQYKNNLYNNKIKGWVFFACFPPTAIWMLFGTVLSYRLADWFLNN